MQQVAKWFVWSLVCTVCAVALLGGAIYVATVSTTVAGWRGGLDARRDISQGRYKLLQFGWPGPGALTYKHELKTRFDIDLQFRGCVVYPETLAYANAYNKVAEDAAIKHFGRDIFKETESLAATESARTVD